MTENFRQTLQRFVDKDYNELVYHAKKALTEFFPYCQKADAKYNGQYLITCIAIAGVTADGNFSQKEKQFLCDVIGFTMQECERFSNSYKPSLLEDVDKFADSLPPKEQADLVIFIICVSACDETISREETAFINKLLER